MEYFILIILWCGWCTLHSAMISPTVTAYLRERLGGNYRFYRLFYNAVAAMTLAPVIQYGADLRGQVLFRWDGFLQVFQVLLTVIAVALFIAGGKKYDMLQMLGFRQIISGKSHAALSAGGNIDTTGILSLTRHPWYLATIIAIWVGYREMYAATLIANVILTGYIVIGTHLEERKLVAEFGDEYRAYQQRVSMLLPLKWLASRRPKV